MVRVRQVGWVLAMVALTGVRPAQASGISITGNVANDFPQSSGDVQVTQIGAGPGWIAGPTGDTPGTLVGGWDIQDIRTSYNSSTDTLLVGIHGYPNASGQ